MLSPIDLIFVIESILHESARGPAVVPKIYIYVYGCYRYISLAKNAPQKLRPNYIISAAFNALPSPARIFADGFEYYGEKPKNGRFSARCDPWLIFLPAPLFLAKLGYFSSLPILTIDFQLIYA
jgi:hypothetical protein